MTADPEVRLPGERRWRSRDKALREGLAVPEELLAKLRDLAEAPSHA
jgi:LDH2 family malate/lactate/ureidoglycolate dehydrogenase